MCCRRSGWCPSWDPCACSADVVYLVCGYFEVTIIPSSENDASLKQWAWVLRHLGIWALAFVVIGLLAPSGPKQWLLAAFGAGFIASLVWVMAKVAIEMRLSSGLVKWRTLIGLTGEQSAEALVEVVPAGGRFAGSIRVFRFRDGTTINVANGRDLSGFLRSVRAAAPNAHIEKAA